jgi:hypothetical protein
MIKSSTTGNDYLILSRNSEILACWFLAMKFLLLGWLVLLLRGTKEQLDLQLCSIDVCPYQKVIVQNDTPL